MNAVERARAVVAAAAALAQAGFTLRRVRRCALPMGHPDREKLLPELTRSATKADRFECAP
jgi:hypothetical protein